MASGPAWTAAEMLSRHTMPEPGKPSSGAESTMYLVAMHGRFYYNGPQPPPRRGERQKQTPSTVLEVIINESGLVAASAWMDNVPVPLSHLGPVTRLRYSGEPAIKRRA